jgi:hypothetical protein
MHMQYTLTERINLSSHIFKNGNIMQFIEQMTAQWAPAKG